MRFSNPWLLSLVVVGLVAGVWAAYAARRGPSLSFPAQESFWRERRRLGAIAAWLAPSLLPAAALILLAVGLARPQRVMRQVLGLGAGIDIMLVLDTSISMRAVDFDPLDRIGAAKDTARRFILGRREDRIGLVVFGGAAILACPMTLDYGALVSRVEEMAAGMTQSEGTAIGDGIVSAVNRLKSSSAKSKVLIVLTDGRSNAGIIDPLTAAKTASAFGIRIYTIGTAKRGQSVIPVDDPHQGRVMVPLNDDLDEETLAEVARLGGGKFWRATSLSELRDVYDEIDLLEKSEVKLPDSVSFNDLYALPVWAAAAILLLEAALSATWLLRWP